MVIVFILLYLLIGFSLYLIEREVEPLYLWYNRAIVDNNFLACYLYRINSYCYSQDPIEVVNIIFSCYVAIA